MFQVELTPEEMRKVCLALNFYAASHGDPNSHFREPASKIVSELVTRFYAIERRGPQV